MKFRSTAFDVLDNAFSLIEFRFPHTHLTMICTPRIITIIIAADQTPDQTTRRILPPRQGGQSRESILRLRLDGRYRKLRVSLHPETSKQKIQSIVFLPALHSVYELHPSPYIMQDRHTMSAGLRAGRVSLEHELHRRDALRRRGAPRLVEG